MFRWEIKPKSSEKDVIEAVPQQIKTIGKVPSTRLAISDTFEHLAIGTSDGKIYIIKTDDFKEVDIQLYSQINLLEDSYFLFTFRFNHLLFMISLSQV